MKKIDENYFIQDKQQKLKVEDLLANDEKILWKGKPRKISFIMQNSSNLMPFAILWLIIDVSIIISIFSNGGFKEFGLFIIPFFALHLMPVWIWLSKVLTARRRYENMEYCVTDKRIIIKSGFIGANYVNIMYKDVHSVNVHVGILDKMFGVGDVMIDTGYRGKSSKSSLNNSIIDVENPYEVMQLIQKTVIDMQSDINYPNALRPEVNEGYKTVYKPDDDTFSSGSN